MGVKSAEDPPNLSDLAHVCSSSSSMRACRSDISSYVVINQLANQSRTMNVVYLFAIVAVVCVGGLACCILLAGTLTHHGL